MAVEAYGLSWYRFDSEAPPLAPPTVDAASRTEPRPMRSIPSIAAIAVALTLFTVHIAAAQSGSKTLVAVFAHADDEGAAAPVLARYAREGVQVYLIIATDGAQGGMHTTIPRGPELARIRSDEARCAARTLGIHEPLLLGFPDAELGNYMAEPARLFELAARIQRELQRLAPDALITWSPDGATGHPDHRLVSSLVTQLVRAGAPGATERLFYVSIPVEGMRAMNPSRAEPAFLVPLPKYFSVRVPFTAADDEAARRSMACHKTQYSDDVVQRIAGLQSRIWNGALSFAPFLFPEAGDDLLRSR
jgi:LmbE family N-acetylglucosaminyl deacetylase